MGSKKIERHTSGFDPDEYPDELERLEAHSLSWKPYDGLFPSREHPLWEGFTSPDPKLTPEQWQRQNHGTVVPTAQRLQEAYNRAKENNGITLAKWADKCSNHGKDKNVARRWLESPSTMERSEVLATCELFGCSLEYLQGREWDVEYVAKIYKHLSSKNRVKLCSYLSDLDYMDYRDKVDRARRAAKGK